jgi:hypothetical protein
MAVPRAGPKPLAEGPVDNGASSVIVFQAPQSSQRPVHLEWTAPQLEQVNDAAFTMTPS